MPNATLSGSAQPSMPVLASTKLVVAIVLAAWFALIMVLGATGAFVTRPGTLPFPIAIGVTTPILLFLAGFWLSRPFREFVLAADVRLMLGIQGWRFAGLGFLALYAHGVLPGSFAWPAGLGDMAIGATAPWLLVALIRQPTLRGQQDLRGVESARATGPRRGGWHRGAQFGARRWCPWGGHHRPDGTVAARAHPSLPCAHLRHAAFSCAHAGAAVAFIHERLRKVVQADRQRRIRRRDDSRGRGVS